MTIKDKYEETYQTLDDMINNEAVMELFDEKHKERIIGACVVLRKLREYDNQG